MNYYFDVLFLAPTYEYIKVDYKGEGGRVGVITLNRPKALNALCNELMLEVTNAIQEMDSDTNVGAIVITGNEKAFAAGKIVSYCKID